jgi:transposase-like protein
MERRSKYSDADRARVFAALEANEGNIKRTARETGYPVSTVREWKTKWARNGVESEVIDAIPAIVTDFVTDAERVRNKLLTRLEHLVDTGQIDGRTIVPALGMLTDKIRAYKGLDAVKEHHHVLEIPALDEMEAKLSQALGQLVAVGNRRQETIDEVVELEPSQYRELQPTKES